MRVALAAVLVTLALPASAAPNDFEILLSNVPAYSAKQTMEKGTSISVPEGGEITFLDRTRGSVVTRKCSGKYDGPVESCPTRAGRDGPSTTGATRGVTR